MKPKLGRIIKIENDNPKFGALKKYNFLRVKDNWGVEMNLMFTDRQLLEAEKRAAKNPEDVVQKITFKQWLRS
jgi:hypothetical protein|tara:strand:+ start:165 stop:383 length:219 start_codon:yes stop_codon:yes gene_type:complete